MSSSNSKKTPGPKQKSPFATKSSQKPGSVQKQQSLLSFFTKAVESPVPANKKGDSDLPDLSSDPVGPSSPANQEDTPTNKHRGRRDVLQVTPSSPSIRALSKRVSYTELCDDDDDVPVLKRGIKRTIRDDDDDLEFLPQDNLIEGSDDGEDDCELYRGTQQ
ncbi:hypothetical protein B9Z19DRAFT_1096160 [Tuber borchii]|uniref:Uncharacterized protein n=1 Tax=Tuber borchii TaxID=42251 RepID=A0A2T6ZC00_TUBBO|nr:hypothetical protein B9Z19DRAFT_1096160 [Tuber borchii]